MTARILIVEDESIVQLDLRNRLRRLGHAVVGAASSGEEAIAKAAELEPDLVLMDVSLEGSMDGIEAATRIRAAREIPILFLTAHPSGVAERQEATPYPGLVKPFRPAELQAAIDRALTSLEKNSSPAPEQSKGV